MYISRVYIKNYRNFKDFDLFIPNGNPLTIIGGNNVGKSNLLKAIRLVLDNQMPAWERQLGEDDFSWGLESEPWRSGEEVVVTLTLSSIQKGEESNEFIQALTSVTRNDEETEDAFNGNISFVFAPEFKKKESYSLREDYRGFLVAGKYHPSGFEINGEGVRVEYPTNLTEAYAGICAEDLSDFYKVFYLSPNDLVELRKQEEVTQEGLAIRPHKQIYTSKIRRRVNLLYLDALRDVSKDFFDGYNSVVSQLIKYKLELSGQGDAEFYDELTQGFSKLRKNQLLDTSNAPALPKGEQLMSETEDVLKDGNNNLLEGKANLQIGTPKISQKNVGKYFNFLSQLLEDDDAPESVQIVDLGLGYQNLSYISAIFAIFELKKKINNPETGESNYIYYNLLLTEEPEAHLDVQNQKDLHTQIESKTQQLMEVGEEEGAPVLNTFTQVIQTSHSTHLTSKASLDNVIVLERSGHNTLAVNVNTAIEIENENYEHDRRIISQYLDATRSAMLFARKVVLVEGAAEKFALPTLINLFLKSTTTPNRTIDRLGIEVVEVGFKGYSSFYSLYGTQAGKLHNKCLGVVDGDYQNDIEAQELFDLNTIHLGKNANSLKRENVYESSNVYTFEVDTFFLSGLPTDTATNNLEWLKCILKRFQAEGKYYATGNTFDAKIAYIDTFLTSLLTTKLSKEQYSSFFSQILYAEVTKPTIALYLASLVKAKHLGDQRELASWTSAGVDLESLPGFILPSFLTKGLEWLVL